MRWKRRIVVALAVLLLLAALAPGARILWRRTRGPREIARFEDIIRFVHPLGGGAVLAVDKYGHVKAVDLDSGQELWRQEVRWPHQPSDVAGRDGLAAVLSEFELCVLSSGRVVRHEVLPGSMKVCFAGTPEAGGGSARAFVLAAGGVLYSLGVWSGGVEQRQLALTHASEIVSVGSAVFVIDPTRPGLYRVDGQEERVDREGPDACGDALGAGERTVVWHGKDERIHVFSLDGGVSRTLPAERPWPHVLAVDEASGTILELDLPDLRGVGGERALLLDLATGEDLFQQHELVSDVAAFAGDSVVFAYDETLFVVPLPIRKLGPSWRAVRPGKE
jgi:hypothetical protein